MPCLPTQDQLLLASPMISTCRSILSPEPTLLAPDDRIAGLEVRLAGSPARVQTPAPGRVDFGAVGAREGAVPDKSG